MKRALLACGMILALCGSVAAADDDWYRIEGKSCVRLDKTPDEFVNLKIASGFRATPSKINSEVVGFYTFSKNGDDDVYVSMFKGHDFCERMRLLTADAETTPKTVVDPPPPPPTPTSFPEAAITSSAPPRNDPPAQVDNQWDVPLPAPVEDVNDRWDIPTAHKIVKRPARKYASHRRQHNPNDGYDEVIITPGQVPPPPPSAQAVPPAAPPAEVSVVHQESLPPPTKH